MDRFDLLGPLPAANSTTVLEASAGTGKTFALAGLVTRYVAEGAATLDQMLLITFGRAASQELRERVRDQIVDALEAFDDPSLVGDNQVVAHLLDGGSDDQRATRRRDLRDALAELRRRDHRDHAPVLPAGAEVAWAWPATPTPASRWSRASTTWSTEIVDDLYLRHFGQERDDPVLTYEDALRLAREVVEPPGDGAAAARPGARTPAPRCASSFAKDVLAELERRKRRLGILGYDDLLTRLADALEADDSPAQLRMHRRWPIVMVDEFQDTDPVQWQVIDRAFSGRSTVILIGDPKQAIYAFRGGDIVTYLKAAETAGDKQTLGTNWRSDGALVDRLQAVLRGAATRRPADRRARRRRAPPRHAGSRARRATIRSGCGWCTRETFGRSGTQNLAIDDLRTHIPRDLAADIGALLASGATFDGEPLEARDIAVIVESHKDARACHRRARRGRHPVRCTPATPTSSARRPPRTGWRCWRRSTSRTARAWCGPRRRRCSSARPPKHLSTGGDALTDRVAETLREWAGHARERGVAAIFEAAQLSGMGDRVLSWQGGERHMTDLAHMTQLLQEAAHREHFSLPALRDWLRDAARRAQWRNGTQPAAGQRRGRRADHDGVGEQGPAVSRWCTCRSRSTATCRTASWCCSTTAITRCLHVGGKDSPDYNAVAAQGRKEEASDDSRLTYVAMTRAQSQVVAWWAPSYDEPNGGLSRLLRGRGRASRRCPIAVCPRRSPTTTRWRGFAEVGGCGRARSSRSRWWRRRHRVACRRRRRRPRRAALPPRDRHRVAADVVLGADPRRRDDAGVSSEPEVVELDDEVAEIPVATSAVGAGRAVADGGPADGREVRHAGARGVGDGGPVRG